MIIQFFSFIRMNEIRIKSEVKRKKLLNIFFLLFLFSLFFSCYCWIWARVSPQLQSTLADFHSSFFFTSFVFLLLFVDRMSALSLAYFSCSVLLSVVVCSKCSSIAENTICCIFKSVSLAYQLTEMQDLYVLICTLHSVMNSGYVPSFYCAISPISLCSFFYIYVCMYVTVSVLFCLWMCLIEFTPCNSTMAMAKICERKCAKVKAKAQSNIHTATDKGHRPIWKSVNEVMEGEGRVETWDMLTDRMRSRETKRKIRKNHTRIKANKNNLCMPSTLRIIR